MFKLFRFTLRRRLFNKFFLIAVFALALIFFIPNNYSKSVFASFSCVMFINAVLSCVNIGMEFRYGTIRNMLIFGYTKTQFFVSELLTSVIEALLLFAFSALEVYILLYDQFLKHFKAEVLLLIAGLFLLACLLMSVICVLVCCLSKKVTLSLILCVGLIYAFFYTTVKTDRVLRISEYCILETGETVYNEKLGKFEDVVVDQEIIPNEFYLSGINREIVYTVRSLTPLSPLDPAERLLDINNQNLTFKEIKENAEKSNKENELHRDYDFMCRAYSDLWSYPAWLIPEMTVLIIAGIILFRRSNIT